MGQEILELCARPSFREGIARLFDFSGSLNIYNYSPTEEEADYRALLSDWIHVANDLQFAITQFNVKDLGEKDDSRK